MNNTGVVLKNIKEELDCKTFTYGELQKMTVEELADLAKFGNLASYKVEAITNIMVEKLSQKAHQSWAAQLQETNKTFEELSGSKGYVGEITTKAFNYAFNVYGQLDKKSGNRIPFEKHYWAAFGLKNQDATSEYLKHNRGEEQKAKQEEIKQFVADIADKNNKKNLIPRISLLKQANLEKALDIVGATQEECAHGVQLLEKSRIFFDGCYDENGEETGNYLSDVVSVDRYYEAEASLELVIDGAAKALQMAKNEKEKEVVRCLLTMQLVNYVSCGNYAAVSDLRGFVEKGLLEKANMTGKKDNELLMEYLGIKDRELRRRKSRAEELLACGFALAERESCGDNSAA